MAGAELVADFGIILGALIDILDHQHDRRSGGHRAAGAVVLEDAGENFYFIRLAALRGEARLPRPALVEIGLDIGRRQRYAGRAAIDHAADCRPVAFAEGGHAEEMAECVVRHGY